MFKYNNTHIFTGYLKQFLASFNLPACKIYTQEFAKYLERHNQEDPRIIQSFDLHGKQGQLLKSVRVNYLKGNELYNYFGLENPSWQRSSDMFYSSDKTRQGLTINLNSAGPSYDTATHTYLGEYLRFLRDYHGVNLMSLYNCFTDKICNNIYYKHTIKMANTSFDKNLAADNTNPKFINTTTVFDSQDPSYKIYAIPVKLFAEYTFALDCDQGIELFCGFYKATLDTSEKAKDFAAKTYIKVGKTLFNQPFVYDKLNKNNWLPYSDFIELPNGTKQINNDIFTRYDIVSRERDLRLFIKIPVSCKSSIVILEGDYRNFNDFKYIPVLYNKNNAIFNPDIDAPEDKKTIWTYYQNKNLLNFNTVRRSSSGNGDGVDLNNYDFRPISKLQLLAFNTGESYPFADRLIEYLSGSVITPIDEVPDNIKRAQHVMAQNQNYFQIEGLWENKMQSLIYDSMMNSGPTKVVNERLTDAHSGNNPNNYGYHPRLGKVSRSSLYDVLGYVDKDAEKWYVSWENKNGEAQVKNSIQNVDIYNGLYDI